MCRIAYVISKCKSSNTMKIGSAKILKSTPTPSKKKNSMKINSNITHTLPNHKGEFCSSSMKFTAASGHRESAVNKIIIYRSPGKFIAHLSNLSNLCILEARTCLSLSSPVHLWNISILSCTFIKIQHQSWVCCISSIREPPPLLNFVSVVLFLLEKDPPPPPIFKINFFFFFCLKKKKKKK